PRRSTRRAGSGAGRGADTGVCTGGTGGRRGGLAWPSGRGTFRRAVTDEWFHLLGCRLFRGVTRLTAPRDSGLASGACRRVGGRGAVRVEIDGQQGRAHLDG